MDKQNLGRLTKVELRTYWEREDTHFTPWLAEEQNISLLGDTIGIELEVQEQEANVGPFRADILCRNTSDNTLVLIENQLERTDHTHLGQLMTYAAGLDAVTLVWVVERFTEEHRAAIDWLNRITDEGFHLFGLEIELWRIGDSVPAPKFNLVAKPNDWAKTVRETAQSQAKSYTQSQQSQVDYWASFAQYIGTKDTNVKPPKPAPSNWVGYGVGRTGVGLIASVKIDKATVFVETDNNNHPGWFHLLFADKEKIEQELGFNLTWDERANRKYSQIGIVHDFNTRDLAQWPIIHRWMLSHLESMRKVFRPKVKRLNDMDWQPSD
jgi:hypothetical protein